MTKESDRRPPVISTVWSNPARLWPPNKKLLVLLHRNEAIVNVGKLFCPSNPSFIRAPCVHGAARTGRVSDLPNFSNFLELASGYGSPPISLAENTLSEGRAEKSLLMECHSEWEKEVGLDSGIASWLYRAVARMQESGIRGTLRITRTGGRLRCRRRRQR